MYQSIVSVRRPGPRQGWCAWWSTFAMVMSVDEGTRCSDSVVYPLDTQEWGGSARRHRPTSCSTANGRGSSD